MKREEGTSGLIFSLSAGHLKNYKAGLVHPHGKTSTSSPFFDIRNGGGYPLLYLDRESGKFVEGYVFEYENSELFSMLSDLSTGYHIGSFMVEGHIEKVFFYYKVHRGYVDKAGIELDRTTNTLSWKE